MLAESMVPGTLKTIVRPPLGSVVFGSSVVAAWTAGKPSKFTAMVLRRAALMFSTLTRSMGRSPTTLRA